MEIEPNFVKVCNVDDVPEGQGKIVHAGTKKLALFRVKGEFFCIQNFCPHAGGFLGLGPLEGYVVRCPRHAWGFDITTGACKTNARYEVTTYLVKVEDGSVFVAVPENQEIF